MLMMHKRSNSSTEKYENILTNLGGSICSPTTLSISLGKPVQPTYLSRRAFTNCPVSVSLCPLCCAHGLLRAVVAHPPRGLKRHVFREAFLLTTVGESAYLRYQRLPVSASKTAARRMSSFAPSCVKCRDCYA